MKDDGVAGGSRKPLNPNWTQLQQKLGAGRRRFNHDADSAARTSPATGLGKRKERDDTGIAGSPPLSAAAVLAPTSSDCSVTDALGMDCEMVGVSTDGSRSALARVTLVNSWGNVVYDEYVRPLEHIVDFRTSISGIRPWNMKKAKMFNVVQKKVSSLIKGRLLVGHALHNDLKVLFLSHPKKDIRDTSEYGPFRRNGKRRSLRDLASEILGIGIQKREHCSIEDARAAMLIYQKYKKDWEKSIKQKVKSRKKRDKIAHKEKDDPDQNQKQGAFK